MCVIENRMNTFFYNFRKGGVALEIGQMLQRLTQEKVSQAKRRRINQKVLCNWLKRNLQQGITSGKLYQFLDVC